MRLPGTPMRMEARFGRISSVDAKRHTAQVQFEEIDGFVSYDLQILVTRRGDYSLPVKDDPVLCALLEGYAGVGYVLGVIYTESDDPPTDDKARRVVAGDDVRLGAADADDFVALASKVKDELDAIKSAFNNHTHLAGTLVSPPGIVGGPVTGATAPVVASYNPNAVAAEKVKAK